MFRNLRVRKEPQPGAYNAEGISINQLIGDASLPISIATINSLPENPKIRLYRLLIPIQVLAKYDVNPRTWKNTEGQPQVKLAAKKGSNLVKLSVWYEDDPRNEYFYLELADNPYNGIDLNFILVNDPTSQRYKTDTDDAGRDTQFGTIHRNHFEEERALLAGLAPGQICNGLRGSEQVITQIESFLTLLAHHAIFLEPLTYVSAWIFERRGFAYVRGHRLMDSIHREFLPGGELYNALDGSNPFRQPEQWKTVRGRAWAIHDGILEVIGSRWDNLRMVKQVGRHAGVETFPGSEY